MKTIEWYQDYAETNGYELSKYAPAIIKMVDKNDGNCPCKKGQDDVICPCPTHKEEIKKEGHCVCSLFLKGGQNG